MDTLMRMQSSYDIARTRLREGQIRVRRIPQLADIPCLKSWRCCVSLWVHLYALQYIELLGIIIFRWRSARLIRIL